MTQYANRPTAALSYRAIEFRAFMGRNKTVSSRLGPTLEAASPPLDYAFFATGFDSFGAVEYLTKLYRHSSLCKSGKKKKRRLSMMRTKHEANAS
jgi:hypothetical protein